MKIMMKKIKWCKLFALMILLPLAGCAVDVDEENAETLAKAELGIEKQVDGSEVGGRTNNAIDLLPDYISIEVHWEDLADNEEGFLIERSTSESGDFILLTALEMDKTTYLDEKVKQGSTYCYRIGAYNNVGVAYSDVSCKSS